MGYSTDARRHYEETRERWEAEADERGRIAAMEEAIGELRRATARHDASLGDTLDTITAVRDLLSMAASHLTTDPPSIAHAFAEIAQAIERLTPLAKEPRPHAR